MEGELFSKFFSMEEMSAKKFHQYLHSAISANIDSAAFIHFAKFFSREIKVKVQVYDYFSTMVLVTQPLLDYGILTTNMKNFDVRKYGFKISTSHHRCQTYKL